MVGRKFLITPRGLSASHMNRPAKAQGIPDAQTDYAFQPGSTLEGLSILSQACNLTGRAFITCQNNDERRAADYQRHGRDFCIGLSCKY